MHIHTNVLAGATASSKLSKSVLQNCDQAPCSTSTVADTKWEKELLNKTLEPIKVKEQSYSTTSLGIQRLWRAEWVLIPRHENAVTGKRKGDKIDGDNEEDQRRVWIEVRQRGKKLHGAKPWVKDTMMCTLF